VTSTEVLENVRDDRAARSPRSTACHAPVAGWSFTVPLMDVPDTIERARLENGTVVQLRELEYHGDRRHGWRAVLAFRTYGLDVLEWLRDAGFEARVERVDDRRHAIVTDKVAVGLTPE
jgi:hypothetical protein